MSQNNAGRTRMLKRPAVEEIPEDYRGYVAHVNGDDLVSALHQSETETLAVLSALPAAKELHRYAPDKWSVREVLGHVIDAERVFGYRALRFSRQDPTPLPGFDENHYVPRSGAADRRLADLLAEYRGVRTASVSLLSPLTNAMLDFRGTASGKPMTARVLGWIIAGHNLHHLSILRERYLL
jgi:hypothetical protein